MQPDQIRHAFESAKALPAEALTAAIRHADALAPAVIATIEKAARGVYLLPGESNLLFFGLHALAAARHRPLYRPLMGFLRRPEAAIDPLLGDAVGATLAAVVLAVYDADPEPLLAVIEDIFASSYVRWAMLDVLVQLTEDGAVPREMTTALLDRFERERLAEDDDAAWVGWQEAILRLGLTDLAERVRASWEDGRNPQREVDRRDWEERLEAVRSDAQSAERLIDGPIAPLDDPVAALSWMQPKETLAPTTARRDAAAALALDDDELDWLAGFLACEQVPLSTMTLEELDGFLTALVVGPEPIMPSEYIPEILGHAGRRGADLRGRPAARLFHDAPDAALECDRAAPGGAAISSAAHRERRRRRDRRDGLGTGVHPRHGHAASGVGADLARRQRLGLHCLHHLPGPQRSERARGSAQLAARASPRGPADRNSRPLSVWARPACGTGAPAQGWPQRALPLRQRAQVQALLRRRRRDRAKRRRRAAGGMTEAALAGAQQRPRPAPSNWL